MKKLWIIFFWIILLNGIVFSQQNVYYTRNATLQINGEFEGKPVYAKSQSLGVKLDYETTEMIIRLALRDLKSNVDTINQVLNQQLQEIVFEGELSLDHINTKGHPPQKFTAEGWLILGLSKTKVRAKGELHHIDNSGQYACMLGMTMYLDLKTLAAENVLPELEEELEIIIIQALLEKDKN